MVKKINYFTCPGRGSKQCKDAVYFRENGEYGIYSLADGLNSVEKSHIGAGEIQKAIADAFEEQPEYFLEAQVEAVKVAIIAIIKEVLYNLTKEGTTTVDEYASTLMILFVSAKHQSYRCVHIGDGLIVKEDICGKMDIVSHSQNGITRQFTFTTADERLDRYLRMNEGELQDIQRLMLFTDGAIDSFYRERNLTENGEDFLKRGTDVFCRILEQLEIRDDYSMLDIML